MLEVDGIKFYPAETLQHKELARRVFLESVVTWLANFVNL